MTVSRFPWLLFAIFFLFPAVGSAQNIRVSTSNGFSPRAHWVDSVYNTLNDTERIGQLFMIAAYSGGGDYNEDKVTPLVAANEVGGLIFMQGTPEAQAVQNNKYQRLSKVPLLIGMDAEWGLGMRLTGVKDLPRQMMIGATYDTALAYLMGETVAAQAKRLGVHINFAPVVDVNNNPDNPIINARSFGENKVWVARLGIAYMKGMQDNGLMACAKHFPGHGDTKTDSHKDLPVINKSLQELDTLELYPFRQLINAGVKSIMVAHLDIPALETEPHIPTTLSKNTITNLLKTRMGFNGLVFTDALNMQGVTKYFQPGDVDVRALLAGNDMLLFSQDVPVAIGKIMQAINDGQMTWGDIERKVKKILAAKYDAGLADYKPVDPVNITADINKATDDVRIKMAEAGVTLIRDRYKLLDKLQDKKLKIGYVAVNASDSTVLYKDLAEVIDSLDIAYLPKGSNTTAMRNIEGKMDRNDVIIVGVHNMAFYPGSSGNHGLDDVHMSFLKDVAAKKNVIIALMGNAYLLKNFCNVNGALVAYEDDSITQSVTADIMLGLISAKGKLPVTPCPGMKSEQRIIPVKTVVQAKPSDLKSTFFAEDAGVIHPEALEKLSMFIARSIVAKTFPGCRVFASKDGKIFYDESFGYYEYDKKQRVTNNTLYDLASVTKVVSTTLAVMRLYETGKLNLEGRLGDYLPWVRGTDKAGLKIKDLLMHQAGLKSWIPFYRETLDDKGLCNADLYHHAKDALYSIPVAENLYLRNDYRDTVWKRILESPLENKGRYVYSDLDYYFLAAVVEQLTRQHIDKYVEEQFYRPMGLKYITYNPLSKFKESQIAPTEKESIFRCQLIKGYVHDPGAAMFGGVAGHAGVFSTAGDVGAIFQMLMNGGMYTGKQFFKKSTVEKFTAYSSHISRRALGFDKPSPERDDAGPAGNRTTGYAFGHQGFTGTCVWADPGTGVVFVFLSNRVNPSSANNLINRSSVRTTVQDYIYESLGLPIVHNRAEVQKKQLATAP